MSAICNIISINRDTGFHILTTNSFVNSCNGRKKLVISDNPFQHTILSPFNLLLFFWGVRSLNTSQKLDMLLLVVHCIQTWIRQSPTAICIKRSSMRSLKPFFSFSHLQDKDIPFSDLLLVQKRDINLFTQLILKSFQKLKQLHLNKLILDF